MCQKANFCQGLGARQGWGSAPSAEALGRGSGRQKNREPTAQISSLLPDPTALLINSRKYGEAIKDEKINKSQEATAQESPALWSPSGADCPLPSSHHEGGTGTCKPTPVSVASTCCIWGELTPRLLWDRTSPFPRTLNPGLGGQWRGPLPPHLQQGQK